MDIDELSKQFTSIKELRQYCASQHHVINELNKKIIILEEEKKQLEELLSKSVPVIGDSSIEVYKEVSDEMTVCLTQIKILREKAIREELTYEEAKKLDIYVKTLISLRGWKKEKENPKDKLTEEELLAVLGEEEK